MPSVPSGHGRLSPRCRPRRGCPAPFAGAKNVGFQLRASNMPKLYYLCLILYGTLSSAWTKIKWRVIHTDICFVQMATTISIMLCYLSCIKLMFTKIHPCFFHLPFHFYVNLNRSKQHAVIWACRTGTGCFTCQNPQDCWQPSNTFTESGWKSILKPSSPNYNQAPPCQLDHGSKCHIQFFLKHFHHIPGQPILMPNHSFHEEIPPNVQPQLHISASSFTV